MIIQNSFIFILALWTVLHLHLKTVKLICMSYKSLYDVVPAYLPDITFYHTHLNLTLEQNWTCCLPNKPCSYGFMFSHMLPPLHGIFTNQPNPWSSFHGDSRLPRRPSLIPHIWVIICGHLPGVGDVFMWLSSLHVSSSTISPLPTHSRYLGILMKQIEIKHIKCFENSYHCFRQDT